MTAQTQRFSPFGRGWRFLNRFGLLVPLIIGAFLAVLVTITAVSPRYHTPNTVNAGNPADYAIAEPHYFEEQRFWLVKLPDGEFVALYNRDPVTGCALPWGIKYEHMGLTGWFRDACSSSVYDLTGACFGGACEVGLNRLNVNLIDGELIVDPRDGPHGTIRADNGDPVNPPQ
jgi:nitrite reductase/ring-hydroxylating ferredoxin subunit